jgi:hypothetical protein
MLAGTATANAALIDLAFSLDRSGSVGSSNYTLVKQGLSNALNIIPTTGTDQYRVTVVSFASTVSTVVAPTVVTAASLPGIQAAILGDSFTGGATNIFGSIQQIVNEVVNEGGIGDSGLINISTDGEPNVGNTNPQDAQDLATGAGWDSISAEAIGSFDLGYLQTLVFPQPGVTTGDPNNLPNPLDQGFVLTVDMFEDYGGAIDAKVQEIVNGGGDIPEPTTLALFGAGAIALGARARRRRAKKA